MNHQYISYSYSERRVLYDSPFRLRDRHNGYSQSKWHYDDLGIHKICTKLARLLQVHLEIAKQEWK
jgi:hypothetical protein